jgi:hypothetical protein
MRRVQLPRIARVAHAVRKSALTARLAPRGSVSSTTRRSTTPVLAELGTPADEAAMLAPEERRQRPELQAIPEAVERAVAPAGATAVRRAAVVPAEPQAVGGAQVMRRRDNPMGRSGTRAVRRRRRTLRAFVRPVSRAATGRIRGPTVALFTTVRAKTGPFWRRSARRYPPARRVLRRRNREQPATIGATAGASTRITGPARVACPRSSGRARRDPCFRARMSRRTWGSRVTRSSCHGATTALAARR